ncbi:MAG: alpha/beta hydrolase-fold protein [Thermomicrobiales bacterium]
MAHTELTEPETLPAGTLTTHILPPGAVYPGVPHRYQVYVPAQYDPAQPAPCMVFMDGAWIFAERMNAPAALDAAITAGDIPPLIGVFIDYGALPAADEATQQGQLYRHVEYDNLTPRFARFLSEELLPAVSAEYPLSDDPNDRALVGLSSGAIAAFIAAWQRPDQFRRVWTCVGTYVDMLGAHSLPIWVRKCEPKPLRVFLQETTGDNDRLWGNWPLANQAMAEAFAFSHYDYKYVVGPGEHDTVHATEIMPDVLRWLWRDYPQPITAAATGPIFETLLIPGELWEPVWQGAQDVLPAADTEGRVWFADPATQTIQRLADDGAGETIAAYDSPVAAVAMGPDGRLCASQPEQRRILTFGADGGQTTVASDIVATSLTLTAAGLLICANPEVGGVSVLDPVTGARRDYTADGLGTPGCVALSPDQAFLAVLSGDGVWGWTWQVGPDGELRYGQPFFRVEQDEAAPLWRPAAIVVDVSGDHYIPTGRGITLVTQSGRTRETIAAPQIAALSGGPVTAVAFGGPERDWLYAAQGGALFRRRLQRRGAVAWQPVMPAPWHL